MSNNNNNDKLTTISTIGAAVIAAALSAYFISSSSASNSNRDHDNDSAKSKAKDEDIHLLLNKLEEMQNRLDCIEKKEKKSGNKGEGKSSARQQEQHRQQQQTIKRNPANGDADTNANVIPPPRSDDDEEEYNYSNNGKKNTKQPPQTITTKPKLEGDRASKFLDLLREESLRSVSISHHSQRNLKVPNIITKATNNATNNVSNNGAYSSAGHSTPTNLRTPIPIILISDPGQDLDDEMMFIMARHLVSLDLISLKGVIANLSPSFARARLTRGTLDLLGLHRVPVGIGTDGGDVAGKHSSDQFETTASSYIVQEDGEAARGLESGHRLLQRLYEDADDVEYVDVMENEADGERMAEGDEGDTSMMWGDGDSNAGEANKNNKGKNNKKPTTKQAFKGGLTIVVTSSMKDMAIFVRDNPTLFASKTREVIVMGGCKPVPITDTKTSLASTTNNVWSNLSKVECEPDSAHNNTFDPAASNFFYSQCQKMNITLTVVSRYAAYAAKMPRSVYDDLALTGSSIGWRLRNSQRASIDQLWRRACSLDPKVRNGLPPRCDRKWFIGTFCGGDDDPSRCCADTAWDLVTGFMQYDTIALLAAIPAVREIYFDPFVLPPLQQQQQCVSDDQHSGISEGLGQLRIDEGKVLDLSVQEEDDTVTAGAATERRRSSMGTGCESTYTNNNKHDGMNGSDNDNHRSASRRSSCPDAVGRAIARAKEDNQKVETPFESPGSNIPEAFDRGTRNLIGISDKEHNLKDPSLLVNLLNTGYRQGILCNHHTQPHIILHLQLRWDNLADTLLTCLMLRSLWDMRLASVLGVIVSIYPSDSNQAKRPPDDVSASEVDDDDDDQTDGGDCGCTKQKQKQRTSDVTMESTDSATPHDQSPSTLAALAETIRTTLCSIGLAHVKFVVVSGKNMDEHKQMSTEAFRDLYESSPPIGVTLVLTATFSSVWPFAESHPDLFRNKTVRVVHTGGALIWPARWGWAASALPSSDDETDADLDDSNEGLMRNGELTDEKILVPDPAAQNHRLDMSSARLFYKRAQALSVPMVILSRHVAKECCIPRNFFDVLGSHGGEVGKRIYDSERNSLLNLWRCSCAPVGSAARANLPERCDASWFAENFCAGRLAASEEEVWESVEAVNLYSPIALLAALPGETLRSYFQTMPFPVRSATHHVIGLTEEVPGQNVRNPTELRSLVVQSLLSAALANESEFGQDPPPMVPIRMNHEQRWHTMHDNPLANSVISAVTSTGSDGVDEDDMWTFSEAARRELFSRTVAQTNKNASLPKEKKRKFVMTAESRIAATIDFIPPPQTPNEET
mmetsp:Transcript_8387/g.18791  ORF Transcript_8387/g.18791 Transcript_8387/m.18791 type:complete len:1311 (+) Transcript_8387:243-4175(+)|eukprot:CAMPEP_0172321492 /NCGR_PEP_ID=MMETSP1058-20130122/43553_1 /TAXON_ID=83371 /ORGANISM="Detonula confervacea, Strain CCMP 353" /LENGTH=1310 /DNA_ID=CAMNT_0013037013 /DNA_START=163 /DNA_END=4095 /DNA_ORIENTATION=+